MRILITGITGFVGSHLAEYTLDKAEVHGLKRWRSSMDNISHIEGLTLHDCDLQDLGSLFRVFERIEFDKVFHLAAQSYVPFSYQAPIKTLMDNVIGTANLLEAIRLTAQDSLIHICSSSEVYGQVGEKDIPIKETQPFNPVSPYGVSKVGEDMLGLQYYTAYGLKTVRTRMFTHTGPRRGQDFVCSNFARQIAQIEKKLVIPTVWVGNLESVRTICDVRDAVRAYWMLNEDMVGEVYNIGGQETLTVYAILLKLIDMSPMKSHIQIAQDETRLRPADVTLQIPDCSKFKEATGWQPEISLTQTLQDLLDYWRERV